MTHATTDDLDLLYTDVEDSLRASLRSLLDDRCAPADVVALYDGDRSLVGSLWPLVGAELGLAGLLVPEAAGGAGASAREAAVVLEELGRAVAPVPFLTSSVLATLALLPDGPGSQPGPGPGARGELLAALAAGERTAALVVPLSAAAFAVRPSVLAGERGLEGRVTSVAGALEADALLVPVATSAGVELHLVETAAARVHPVLSLDMTRQVADVELAGAGSTLVVGVEDGARALRQTLTVGAALLASEQLGIAQWCLDTTVAYLQQRRQFGRVLGGFQALKHRLADLYVVVESARAAARHAAAATAANHPDAELAASLAQAYCADVAVRAAEECVQLHGGLGMTWEHPAHLYLKRAKTDQIALGTPAAHRLHLSRLVDLPLP
ncbi:acyl-CoA dehydrogenase family protein [Nocardioides mesophilus]|uniref:Acyl-CoA/acyl-ACP dehydrogenase n=1 Tax=Nocardioides mesophilus TaxID=433659 RepID=A0A7G9RB13_9ACTN|nr:acyl-CoA dehydrogenase family protein [Nocardioides mesophilus]QNN52788.1 acyl-CoA/acyl-ACP dehydrogenase [Nocardioides mesophilus]